MKDTTDHRGRRRRAWVAPLTLATLFAACDEDVAPPALVVGDGAVEGLLFYDADRNRLFDPAAGDLALEDVQLVLRRRGTEEVLANGTATSDADGRFTMTDVPLGTHDLFMVEASVPEFATFCQNPIRVSVYADETQFTHAGARQSCLVAIEEAEAEPLGEYVTVAGIVVSGSGMIRSGYVHIEDETGGVRLFDYDLDDAGIEVGDRLEVSGTLEAYGGDFQITGVTVNALEKAVADPQPELVTTGEITAAGIEATDPLLGRLVRVEAAEMVADFGANGMHYRNALIDSGDGATIVRLEEAVATGSSAADLDTSMTLGRCYDITGVAGTFNQEGQIFPRTADDIVEVPCS